MVENKNGQRPDPSILARILKKIAQFFDWIAEGQTAGGICKG